MSTSDDVAAVLGQVVDIGSNPREAELGAAVSRHVSARAVSLPPPKEAAAAPRVPGPSPLVVHVEFNDLLAGVGEDDALRILTRLRALFGGSP